MTINPLDFDSDERVPIHRNKKYIIVCARVHPGETNASHIMHGFLDFITGKSEEAKNLRKKNIFKILPMTNPDGEIIGNYRTGLAGNDLNRRFDQPNPKLHPIVFTIRKLF
jgi:murein tripeptide amidase MpaA